MRQKELKSTDWQRNLKIAWIGTFFTGASFSIVMPFMALYIEELGVKGDMVEWYAGLSVAISALASAWFLLFGDAWLTVMVESL